MHTELHDGEKIMDSIDCLIQSGRKQEIPWWYKWLDYFCTLVYLAVYVLVVVIVIRRLL